MKRISCFILEITDKRTEALELTEIAIIPVWLFLKCDSCSCALFCIGTIDFIGFLTMESDRSFMK